jgi:hypothetical protein
MMAVIYGFFKKPGFIIPLLFLCPVTIHGDNGAVLQGGDTFADAAVIDWLPFVDSGTTVGYNLDYENDCGDSLLNGPDVCYSFTPEVDMMLDFSLCQSGFNTQIYIYENEFPMTIPILAAPEVPDPLSTIWYFTKTAPTI